MVGRAQQGFRAVGLALADRLARVVAPTVPLTGQLAWR